jgi:dTMP kinase
MERGKFITLEGGEGAGKSTQARKLVEFLSARDLEAIATREIGGTPGAEEIRALWLDKSEGNWDPTTELLLTMAARREHLVDTVWPALDSGKWVVSDRFVDSARVYQGIGLQLGVDKVDVIYEEIASDFWPDLTLLLDVPVDIGLERMAARGGADDRYQRKNKAFHEKLRAGYLDLARDEPQRIIVIDASKDEAAVTAAIQKAVVQHFVLIGNA